MNHPAIPRLTAYLLLFLAALPPLSAQEVSISGDVSPSPADTPTWDVGEDLIVANTAIGSLTISAGGTVTGAKAFLGVNSGILATVAVSDSGLWMNTEQLIVGYNGQAELTISGGGQIYSVGGFLGHGDTSDGNTATITGAGSIWSSSDTLFIGNLGSDNTVTVSDGGLLSTTTTGKDAGIGFEDGSDNNTLTVTGTGSSFVNDGTVYVGNKGDNNQLEIFDGATVTSKNVRIGGDALSSGNTVTVDGASVWTVSGTQLRIGSGGDNNTLNITGGGTVNVTTGVTLLGRDATSDGNTLFISGEGSTLDTASLTIGRLGTNNTVTVEEGGRLVSGSILIAEQAGSSGTLNIGNGTTAGILDTATVSGGEGTAVLNFNHTESAHYFTRDGTADGEAVLIEGSIAVKHLGTGTTILTGENTYTGGTTISAGTLQVGAGGTTGSIAGDVAVNSSGNLAFNRSDTYTFEGAITGGGAVFQEGTGTTVLTGTSSYTGGTAIHAGTLEVSGTGNVTGGTLFVGDGTYTVSGTGTAAHVGIWVGDTAGTTAVVNVTDGGTLTASSPIFIGHTGTGTLNVSGTDSSVTGSSTTFLGLSAGSSGTLNVTDGATYTTNSNLFVGNNGSGLLTITTGSAVTATGALSVGTTGTADGTITMDDATLTVSSLNLGQAGAGELTASNGSTVNASNSSTFIGNGATGTAVFDASDFNAGALFVGNNSTGSLTMRNGSVLTTTGASAFLAAGGSTTGTVTISGEGSTWLYDGVIFVGNNGNGTLNVLDGGVVTSGGANAFIGAGGNSTGTLLVDGAGSSYTVSGTGDFSVGGLGSNVTVSDGGYLETKGRAFIAAGSGTSADVTVTGADSRWVSLDYISVGQAGTGTLTVADGGVVQVGEAGDGTVYIGDQTINGTLNIGAGAGAGILEASTVTGGFANTTAAVVNFNHTDTDYFFTNTGTTDGTGVAITGNTAVNFTGTGTTTLAIGSTYTGATTIDAGTVKTTNAAAFGSGALTLNGGTLAVQGSLAGSSSLTWNGGNIALSPVSGDAITTTGAFTNGGGGGFIFGSADVEQNVAYTLVNFGSTDFTDADFSALSTNADTTYDATFTVNAGNVEVVINGAASTGDMLHNSENGVPVFTDFTATGDVVSGKTATGQEASTTIGSLTTTNGSSLDVPDANTLTITTSGDTVIVNGSSLNLDGTLIATTLVLDPGSQMTGHGTLQGDLTNGGTLAPGNSPGTTVVAGNYVQLPSGTLQIELASLASFDQLQVSGSASLAGTLEVLSFGGFTPQYGDQFAFLDAASISGTFDTITTWDPALFRAVFLTSGGTGTIVIAPTSYSLMGLTPNQTNVGTGLDSFLIPSSGDQLVITTELDQLTAAQFPAALDAIGPGQYESLASMALSHSNSQSQSLQQHLNYLRLMNTSGVGEIGRNAWAQATGVFGDGRNVSNVPGYDTTAGGVLAGVDLPGSGAVRFGGFLGYQRTDADHNNGGRTEIDTTTVGAYASFNAGNGFYANAILDAGTSRYDVRRPIAFGGLSRTANSDTDGRQISSTVDLGYDIKIGKFTLTPTVGVQYTYVEIDTITESGADALDLRVGKQNADSFRSSAGVRAAYTVNLTSTLALIPQASVLWQHEFANSARTLHGALDGGNTGSFDYRTTAADEDAGYAGAGVALQSGGGWSVYVNYNTQFARGDAGDQSITTGVNVSF